MDANKTAGEETWWQLHKNAACNPQQVLAATPNKTPTVRPPAPYHENYQVRRTRHAGHCWRSRDELIRDVLLWIPTHGRAKAGRPARTYIQQLCEDTGCCPEDLPRAMNDREEWRKRVRDIRAASTIWWWWYQWDTNTLHNGRKGDIVASWRFFFSGWKLKHKSRLMFDWTLVLFCFNSRYSEILK